MDTTPPDTIHVIHSSRTISLQTAADRVRFVDGSVVGRSFNCTNWKKVLTLSKLLAAASKNNAFSPTA
jgi:hypothetical protein